MTELPTLLESKLPEDFDLIPSTSTLSSTELDALLVLLVNRPALSTKRIERTIHYSFILDFLNDMTGDINNFITSVKKASRLRLSLSQILYLYIQKKPQEIWKTDKFLTEHIQKSFFKEEKFEAFSYEGHNFNLVESVEIDFDSLKNFLTFTSPQMDYEEKKEVKMSGEKKRLKLISSINKYSSMSIPSGKRIENELKDLQNKGFIKKEAEWSFTLAFYKKWNQRRGEIQQELKDGETNYEDLTLDFYLINIEDRKPVSRYLKYKNQIARLIQY